jgi:hypothetical protein
MPGHVFIWGEARFCHMYQKLVIFNGIDYALYAFTNFAHTEFVSILRISMKYGPYLE